MGFARCQLSCAPQPRLSVWTICFMACRSKHLCLNQLQKKRHLRLWMCLTPKHRHVQFCFCVAVNTEPCREYQIWLYAGGGRDTILDFRKIVALALGPCPIFVADLIAGMEELELHYRWRSRSNSWKIRIATISVSRAGSRVYWEHARAFMRTLAKPGELWRTHNSALTSTSLTFTRDPAKVPHIHQSSGEGAFCIWVTFRMCSS